jgi:hypothetical protein
MTTLPLRAPHLPDVSHDWPVFAAIADVVSAVFDVLVEARQQSLAAQKRYPLAEW